MMDTTSPIPLAKRKKDIFFIVAFSLFACTSFFGDALHALGLLDNDGIFAESNRRYIDAAQDYFLAANHDFSRFNTGVSAFVYGPIYLLLVDALYSGPYLVGGEGMESGAV